MDKNERQGRSESVLLLFLIFLFCASFPFSLWIKDQVWLWLAQGLLRLAFVVGCPFLVRRFSLVKAEWHPWSWGTLLYLPLFALCGSNLFVLVYERSSFSLLIPGIQLLSQAFFYLTVALSEELLFRAVIEGEFLKEKSPLWSILLSALIFAVSHLANFGSVAPLLVLAQVGYTFILGLLLGFLYQDSRNLGLVILYHFLFDFLNDSLFGAYYSGDWDWRFFGINILIGFMVLLYGFLYFKIKAKKKI